MAVFLTRDPDIGVWGHAFNGGHINPSVIVRCKYDSCYQTMLEQFQAILKKDYKSEGPSCYSII